MSMVKALKVIYDRFPSLFNEKNRTGWATIYKDRGGIFDVYRGDTVFLGSFDTFKEALDHIKKEELYYVGD